MTELVLVLCPICEDPVPPKTTAGQRRKYCSTRCKTRAALDRYYAMKGKPTKVIDFPREVLPPVQPIGWWLGQARMLDGRRCPRCAGATSGMYVAPTVETMLECAVVEHCALCGWEHPVVTGRNGVPYEHTSLPPRLAEPPLGPVVPSRPVIPIRRPI